MEYIFKKLKKIMDIEDWIPICPHTACEDHRVPACFFRQGAELDTSVLPSTPRYTHHPSTLCEEAEAALWEPQQFSCSACLAQTARHTEYNQALIKPISSVKLKTSCRKSQYIYSDFTGGEMEAQAQNGSSVLNL